jgi:hypothetical protein
MLALPHQWTHRARLTMKKSLDVLRDARDLDRSGDTWPRQLDGDDLRDSRIRTRAEDDDTVA